MDGSSNRESYPKGLSYFCSIPSSLRNGDIGCDLLSCDKRRDTMVDFNHLPRILNGVFEGTLPSIEATVAKCVP